MKSEEIKIDEEKRKEIFDFALEVIQDAFYNEFMGNLSKVEDRDRNRNFYHGYTKIEYPYFLVNDYDYNGLHYRIQTSASSGKISTKDFAKEFDVDNIEADLHVNLIFYVPNNDTQINFKIEKITMKQFRNNDKLAFNCHPGRSKATCSYDADLSNINETSYPLSDCYYDEISDCYYSEYIHVCDPRYFIQSFRQISQEEINNMRVLDKMPGFMVTWNFSEIENVPKFIDDIWTKEFVR